METTRASVYATFRADDGREIRWAVNVATETPGRLSMLAFLLELPEPGLLPSGTPGFLEIRIGDDIRQGRARLVTRPDFEVDFDSGTIEGRWPEDRRYIEDAFAKGLLVRQGVAFALNSPIPDDAVAP